MLWALAVYIYAGLLMAELSVMHLSGRPLTTRLKMAYIVVLLFWAVHFPYYILKQKRRK